jgi:preprotein translocase subunit SecE
MLGNFNDLAIATATAFIMVAITLTFFLTIFGEERRTFRQREDLTITTGMVFIMVAVTAVFFLIADQIMRRVVTLLLGIDG